MFVVYLYLTNIGYAWKLVSHVEKLSSAGKLLTAMRSETSDLALADYYNNGRYHESLNNFTPAYV
jgi:hypothetical protein